MSETISVKKLTYTKKGYEVVFSNDETILVSEDVVVAHRLVLGKELNAIDLDEIAKSAAFFSFYHKCLSLLAKTRKCQNDIRLYLIKKDCPKVIINQIIDKLIESKLINDYSYAKDYTENLINNGYGRKMIEYRLKQMNIEPSIISDCINHIEEEKYQEMILKLARKQLKNYQKYDIKVRKQKIQKFLINRGYEYDTIYALDIE